MDQALNYFTIVLISISVALGIVIGIFVGPWSLLLAVAGAVIGTWAVYKFYAVPSPDVQ